jgi:hypothetical protein
MSRGGKAPVGRKASLAVSSASMGAPQHSNREFLAFIVSPLVVPAIVSFSIPGGSLGISLTFATIVSYGSMLLIGGPAYLFLKSKQWTSVWIAAGLGIFFGIVGWIAGGALLAFLLESPFLAAFGDPVWRFGMLWPGAVSGMLVGITFWIIARPDRSPQSN